MILHIFLWITVISSYNFSYCSDKATKTFKTTRTTKVQKTTASVALATTILTTSSSNSTSIIHPLLIPKKTSQYNAQRQPKSCYDPKAESYKLSRSQIENFIRCARCFYIDRKLGTGHPQSLPFTLNNAVDNNMKEEFDTHRKNKTRHPYCIQDNINAIPFDHEELNDWRNSLHKGLRHKVEGTNIELQGGVDDIWEDQDTKEKIIVDYKATSKKGDINLDADWQDAYKRQMTMYQYLLRRHKDKNSNPSNFKVSNNGYFVYANAQMQQTFDDKLNFQTSLLSYEGDESWVEQAVKNAYACLQSPTMPPASLYCDYCQYFSQRLYHERNNQQIVTPQIISNDNTK